MICSIILIIKYNILELSRTNSSANIFPKIIKLYYVSIILKF